MQRGKNKVFLRRPFFVCLDIFKLSKRQRTCKLRLTLRTILSNQPQVQGVKFNRSKKLHLETKVALHYKKFTNVSVGALNIAFLAHSLVQIYSSIYERSFEREK